ncbi:MAG: response regulator [Prolixibacteraceae bacterium]|nr:response regulator [Prolixibacteraceae bacterium]
MRLRFWKIPFSFLFLFLVIIGKAQYNGVFEHLSTEDGLSHGSVSNMLKDSRGFMWFATWDGINRYDGHAFKIFKPAECSNVSSVSNRIETMQEDALGNIWVINYDAKAFRLDRKTEKFDPVPVDSARSVQQDIRGMFFSPSGDVWLMTNNAGIFHVVSDTLTNRFTVQHYHENSQPPLPGNAVRFVFEDRQNNIWIKTGKGIARYKAGKGGGLLVREKFGSKTGRLFEKQSVLSFHVSENELFLGTKRGNLLIYNVAEDKLKELDFVNHSAITSLSADSKGNIFAGTRGNGVFVYNVTAKKISNHYAWPGIKNVLKTYPDSKGMLWVESDKPGISKINLQTGHYRHYLQKLDVNPDIRSSAQCGLMEDKNKTLWLTLKGGGFGYYDEETDRVEYFYNEPGNPNAKISNFVNCFYKDPDGVLWMGTFFKGIEKVTFIDNKFRLTQPAPRTNLSIANEVRALLEDSKGFLWVATKNQELFVYDKNYRIITKMNKLAGKDIGRIYALAEGPGGNIYLGTKGNGLFILEQKTGGGFNVKHYLHNPEEKYSLSNNNIYSLLPGKGGEIWIGTYGGGLNLMRNGLFYHPGNDLKNYPHNSAKKVRHVCFDRRGNLWAGATDGILFVEGPGKAPRDLLFRFFNNETGNVKGLKSNDVFWIHAGPDSMIWLASLGGGLSELKKYPGNNGSPEFCTLTKNDGLPSDMIFTITGDERGNLWMSTENGIASYDPENHVFKNYSRYDGILNSGFSEAACATRADGTICMGTYNGLYGFNPSDFTGEQKKIDIVFTGFQLFGKEVEPGNGSALNVSVTETDEVALAHNQNVFSITWAGLDYKLQDKLRYAYKLEGYDNDWRYSPGQNYASYSKIPPGSYTFKVQFSNPELQQFNEPKMLRIDIEPPFWQTTTAYLVYLVMAIVLVELARRNITTMISLRNRVVVERELTNAKLNFFTNISHELRTPLTLILGPANEIKSGEKLSEKGRAYTKLIEQNAQRLLRLVNQLLDFRKVQSNKMKLNPGEVNLDAFIHEVCRNFDGLASEKNISFDVNCTAGDTRVWIDREKMESVIVNLLSNAFKYTPENGKVKVNVLIPEDNAGPLVIEITDNGPGIPKSQQGELFKIFSSNIDGSGKNQAGTGIGLALSKELMRLHGGELSYRTAPGGGASFSIRLDDCLHSGIVQTNENEKLTAEEQGNGKYEKENRFNRLKNRTKKPLVLIVEDNRELRHFLKLQLDDHYRVAEAVNGREGLAKTLKMQPGIVLSDVMMPVMDGISMLDRLKNNFQTSHIPVVLLTAKQSVSSKTEGLKYGADAYMTKPFHSAQLVAQLENLLHQRVLLKEHYAGQERDEQGLPALSVTQPDTEFLDRVKQVVEANLDNSEFKIHDIYTEMGMGRSAFFEKMKGLTGLSPIDFVKEFRLNRAHRLLKTGKYNVAETAFSSGFSDAGYFSKCYKEKFGISPSQVFR